MTEDIFQLSKINQNQISIDIWEQVVNQINKDFSENNVSIELNNGNIQESITSSLRSFLSDLSRSETEVQHLLYRIDVPEKYVRQVLAIQNLDEFTFELAHLILKREIQKVLIRRYYSKIEHNA